MFLRRNAELQMIFELWTRGLWDDRSYHYFSYTDKNKGWKHTRVSYPSDLMTISSRQVKAFPASSYSLSILSPWNGVICLQATLWQFSALASVVYGYLTFNLGMMTHTAFFPTVFLKMKVRFEFTPQLYILLLATAPVWIWHTRVLPCSPLTTEIHVRRPGPHLEVLGVCGGVFSRWGLTWMGRGKQADRSSRPATAIWWNPS